MTVSQRVPMNDSRMRRPAADAHSRKSCSSPSTSQRTDVRMRTRMKGALVLILLLLIGMVLFAGGMMLFSSAMTVKSIAVDGVSDVQAVLEAADFSAEAKLYEIDAEAAEYAILRANPYIESVEVKHVFPNRVEIFCVPREAAYYIEVAGNYFALSADLYVLEQAERLDAFADRGLVHLILPTVKSAVVSRPVVFADDFDSAYLLELLDAHWTSTLFAQTDLLRVESRFDVRMIVQDNYALTLGESEDAELKLKLAEYILQDGTFTGSVGAFLDLRDPKQATAILDKQTDYTQLWRD